MTAKSRATPTKTPRARAAAAAKARRAGLGLTDLHFELTPEVVAFLDGLDPKHVKCRDLGHAVDEPDDPRLDVGEFRDHSRSFERRFFCMRCLGTIVHKIRPSSMRTETRSYDLPDGYLAQGFRVSKAAVRAYRLHRMGLLK